MFGWLKNLRANKEPMQVGRPRGVRFIRGRYDAATSTDNNRRHWANADALSADAAANPECGGPCATGHATRWLITAMLVGSF